MLLPDVGYFIILFHKIEILRRMQGSRWVKPSFPG